jgi:hypothetical protein
MLDDEDYELVMGQDQRFSEDPINIAEDLTEAPNQSSEVSDISAPNPTQEGKPRCIPSILVDHNFIIILYFFYYV